MPDADPIFPLINRRAPLLERLRDDNLDNSVGQDLATVISESVQSDDEEFIEEMEESIRTTVEESLADNLGVDVSDINTDYTEELASLLTNIDESTVLNDDALKSLGIRLEDDSSDEEEEADEDSDLFE